jgi:hypothetical protein
MRDLHNNVKVLPTISPVAVGTTGIGQTGIAVDRAGYQAVEIEFSYGAVTATAAVFTATVQHSDSATAASFASVADSDLLGTEVGAGLGAAVRTDGVGDKVTKRVGYIGIKRYVRALIKSTATAGVLVAANVLLGAPRSAPAAT